MSNRMSTEAHTVYVERRLADREHTTYIKQARAVKSFARGA